MWTIARRTSLFNANSVCGVRWVLDEQVAEFHFHLPHQQAAEQFAVERVIDCPRLAAQHHVDRSLGWDVLGSNELADDVCEVRRRT